METIYIVDRRSYVDRREVENQGDPSYYERRGNDRRSSKASNIVLVESEDELLAIVSKLGDSNGFEFFASFDEKNQIYKIVAKHISVVQRSSALH